MALDNNTGQMGVPGLICLGFGVFIKMIPPNFLPKELIGWLQAVSFLLAIIYYAYSIYKKSKEK